jgi:uncharacterized YigZ family protein
MSGNDDAIISIDGKSRREYSVKGSRFIADAFGVLGSEDIERFLDSVRLEFPDATHHCFAYRLGHDGSEFRMNDDGEPAGSAGRPILTAIEKRHLTNVLVVVTRYYGGTKLGTGGLAKAYASAAGAALGAASVVERWIMQNLIVAFPHDQTGHVMRELERFSVKIVDVRYEEEVLMHLSVRMSVKDVLVSELKNRTRGNIRTLESIAGR